MQRVIAGGEKGICERVEIYTDSSGESELIDIPPMPEAKFTITEEEIVQRKTITRDEAKQAVIELFAQKKELDYAGIMSELGLDLKLIVEVCGELEKEGKIRAIDT